MHAEGHLIGNHTFHHVQLTKVSEEEAREEVVKTSNAIYEITGEYPVYIRPPFGEWREGLDLAVTMIPVPVSYTHLGYKFEITGEIVTSFITMMLVVRLWLQSREYRFARKTRNKILLRVAAAVLTLGTYLRCV